LRESSTEKNIIEASGGNFGDAITDIKEKLLSASLKYGILTDQTALYVLLLKEMILQGKFQQKRS